MSSTPNKDEQEQKKKGLSTTSIILIIAGGVVLSVLLYSGYTYLKEEKRQKDFYNYQVSQGNVRPIFREVGDLSLSPPNRR